MRRLVYTTIALVSLAAGNGAVAEPRSVEIEHEREADARLACWSYVALLSLDAKGQPIVPAEKPGRKSACERALATWPLATRAEAGREASRALRVRHQRANEVTLAWVKENEVAVLEAAQAVSGAIAGELSGLDKRQIALDAKIQPLRRRIDEARLAGNEPLHATFVARLEPLEAERAAAAADRALLSGYRKQIDGAAGTLAGLDRVPSSRATPAAIAARHAATERAARALVSAFDDLRALGLESAQKKMDAALAKTWTDLHVRLADAGIVTRSFPAGREAAILAELTRISDAWARAVALRAGLSEAERASDATAANAASLAAFRRLEALLEDAADLMPEWPRIAAADARAAAVRAESLAKAVAAAEKKLPPRVLDPKMDPASLPGIRDPKTKEVMTLETDFARRTGIRVWNLASDPPNVRVEADSGKLTVMPRNQYESRAIAIARYAELTAGAGMDEYRNILEGRTVPGDQIHDVLPRALDGGMVTDPEIVAWIREDAADRAEVAAVYEIAFTKGELAKISGLDWRGIRRKWREFRDLSRDAGMAPEPLRFRGWLSDEDEEREKLEPAAKKRAEAREKAAFLARLESAAGAGAAMTDTAALTAPTTATTLERSALEAALAAGDETRAAVLWRKVFGAGGTDPALLRMALDEARFQRSAVLKRDSVLGAGPLPKLEKLPADRALVPREDVSAAQIGLIEPPPPATTELRPHASAANAETDGLAPAAEGDWGAVKIVWDEERQRRDQAVIEHDQAVRTIRETTDANRRRHAQTLREALPIAGGGCPEGQIQCGCPEAHDFTACHPGTYDDCSAGMIKHAFP